MGIATPSFFLGILLILFFSIIFRILPASGYVPFVENPIQNLIVMALPVLSVGIAFMATLIRQTRSAMLEVLNQDYILTAKAKGLKGSIILWKHALRNALVPVITVISMQIGRMIGGVVVVETVFLLPGMGKLLVDAINVRDYPLVMAQILFMALVIILVNTLVDIIYLFIDPRISHSGGSK
jgi:peptide/nickel transport system permease protein